jgi:hypothetical protein
MLGKTRGSAYWLGGKQMLRSISQAVKNVELILLD